MEFIDNPIYKQVISDEYVSPDGKRIEGVYCTQDGSAVLVDINVFVNLLSGVEACKKLDRRTAAQNNLKLAREAKSAKARYQQAVILKYIVLGSTKQEIVRDLGVSRGTVNNALKGLNEEIFKGILQEFQDIVFNGVSQKSLDDFKGCNFDYKVYRGKWGKEEQEEQHKIDRENLSILSEDDKLAIINQVIEEENRKDINYTQKEIAHYQRQFGVKPRERVISAEEDIW